MLLRPLPRFLHLTVHPLASCQLFQTCSTLYRRILAFCYLQHVNEARFPMRWGSGGSAGHPTAIDARIMGVSKLKNGKMVWISADDVPIPVSSLVHNEIFVSVIQNSIWWLCSLPELISIQIFLWNVTKFVPMIFWNCTTVEYRIHAKVFLQNIRQVN